MIFEKIEKYQNYNKCLIFFVADRGYREELEKEEKRGTSYDRYTRSYVTIINSLFIIQSVCNGINK